MAWTKRHILFALTIVGVVLMMNVLLISKNNEQEQNDLFKSRQELRRQVDLLSAKANAQAEVERRLLQELSDMQAEVQKAQQQRQQPRRVEPRPVTIAKPAVTVKKADIPTAPPTTTSIATTTMAKAASDDLVIPILVFACNRPAAIVQALDDLIKYRPSKEKFPIIVTRDCNHEETRLAVDKYKDVIHRHIVQPDNGPIPDLTAKEKKLQGYFKISRHYKWALGQVFDAMKYKAAIIMEDDLNISPDFYEYFAATYSLLREDSSLYCVSAWNDNGKSPLIKNDPELLYRSDFFPGLGWMLLDSHWNEYRDKWPRGFWDDWIRQEDQRLGRSCIRPEISRTHTFGEKGVSLGLFYKTHLKFIVLNEQMVEWTKKDLSYLRKEKYDDKYAADAYGSQLIQLSDLERAAAEKAAPSVRIIYNSKNSFKTIAKALNIMNDFKDGVPRTAYRGIVTVVYKGIRVYLTPPPNWEKYDPSWT